MHREPSSYNDETEDYDENQLADSKNADSKNHCEILATSYDYPAKV